MSKFEPQFIQKELEANKLRPLYWIYGPERMKIRELVRRIEKNIFATQGKSEFNFEKYDGSENSVETVMDAFHSISMLGGAKLIVVQQAEDLKNSDGWIEFMKSDQSFDPVDSVETGNVLVLISKGFDSRRKWAKAVQDQAAVIFCDEVEEHQREVAIDYLAKRRKLVLNASEKNLLRSLEPWSLEIIDQELSKVELVQDSAAMREEVILSGVDANARDEFIDALFTRNSKRALKWAIEFGEDMDVHLPILGLISWNLRHLKLYFLEQETRSRSSEKRNPYLLKNLERWKKSWTLNALQNFEEKLFEMDFSLKNTRLQGPALWSNLMIDTKTT